LTLSERIDQSELGGELVSSTTPILLQKGHLLGRK
jgi:hypothetical protein